MAGMDLPVKAIREQIASAVHLINCGDALLRRHAQGLVHHRGVGTEVDIVTLQDIFYYKQEGFSEDGKQASTRLGLRAALLR